MGPVIALVLAFVATSLFVKYAWERIELFLKSNYKYLFLDSLASYVHYGMDVGLERSLCLDDPTDDVYHRRLSGHMYLATKLGGGGVATAGGGDDDDDASAPDRRGRGGDGAFLSKSLVDCRFALAKVCMPLLRELEFDPNVDGRNYVRLVRNGNDGTDDDGSADDDVECDDGRARRRSSSIVDVDDLASTGMMHVITDDGIARPYVGNDAVHTLGSRHFYAPIQEEINRRMSLLSSSSSDDDDDKDDETRIGTSMLRFCPIAMNGELTKNVSLIKKLTGMDRVRYSLSGSEAVDGAIKDIRASCDDKPLVVRFASAYHGHVSGVSVVDCPNHVFLPECDDSSLDFIERYHYRICAVIINPMQHFTGINKASPPGEKVNHGRRVRSSVPREVYARWLHDLQAKCNYCTKYLTRVALVVDDIYFAFRTPELLSANYFVHPDTNAPLRPDVIILGKALAAGYPLSAIAGRDGYLNSYDRRFLLRLNKTVGTLAAWHGGIVASNVFLEAVLDGRGRADGTSLLEIPARDQLASLVRKCDAFVEFVNAEMSSNDLPVRVRNFGNTFSVDFLSDSLYNSRYPQYLLAEGMFLGNYSTGKFNLNADATKSDLMRLGAMFVSAADRMQRDGYFEPMTKSARRRFLLSLIARFAGNYARLYYDRIMSDKHIDIAVSHNHPVNKFGHFWSSVGMILFAYPLIFWYGEPLKGCAWFFLTHVVRQSGHFFYEHQDRDIEKLKFGHKDASKKEAVAFLSCAAIVYNYREELLAYAAGYIDPSFFQLSLDQYVSVIALFTVVPHFVEIVYQYGLLRGLSWALKIVTDPFTDLLDFYTHVIIHPRWFLDFKEHRATYRLDISTKKVIKVA